MPVRLNPAYRAAALTALESEEFDLLIIGGGVVGAGAAFDAAGRGLSVALIEAQDWAAGTSSRSSRLIHGGLRYLEQRDFRLVREALRERSLLLHRLAPHLVRPVPFLYPLRKGAWERAYVGAGVLLYDVMGGARGLPWHRHLSRGRALRLGPSLRSDRLTGAVRYYDAQVDDARFTLLLARTAAQHGATVVTRATATELVMADGAVTGAKVRDGESGRELLVRARRVISATGVWTDQVQRLVGETAGSFHVTMSKGVHLLVPRGRIQLTGGLITRTDRSVLFIIPWHDYWIIGTTDTPWTLDRPDPLPTGGDLQYLLTEVNSLLRQRLTADDVVGVYAGLRPLLQARSDAVDETTTLSREHAVAEPAPGLFVVAGGKYTTYRVMAAQVVDAAVTGLGRAVPRSLTERLPILGAVRYQELWAARQELAARSGVPLPMIERLLGRHGGLVTDLLALIREDPSLGRPVAGTDDYLAAEIVYAVTNEGAMHLEDLVERRTRMATETPDHGARAAAAVAGIVAPLLGWDDATRAREVAAYRSRARAHRAALAATDDRAAAEVRRQV